MRENILAEIPGDRLGPLHDRLSVFEINLNFPTGVGDVYDGSLAKRLGQALFRKLQDIEDSDCIDVFEIGTRCEESSFA